MALKCVDAIEGDNLEKTLSIDTEADAGEEDPKDLVSQREEGEQGNW